MRDFFDETPRGGLREPIPGMSVEARMRDQARRIGACGEGYVVLWKDAGAREKWVRQGCGQRGCDRCGARARRRAQSRVTAPASSVRWGKGDEESPAIEWRTIVTMTYPRGPHWSVRDRRWYNADLRLEEEEEGGPEWNAENVLYRVRSHITKMWRIIRDRRQKQGWGKQKEDPRMQYAWAIELHPGSPWPHVHMVLSHPWPESEEGVADFRREMREAWMRAIGADWVWMDVDKVRDKSAGARYLTKYIAKQEGWDARSLAVLYRRRMWSTSLPDEGEKRVPEWSVVRGRLRDVVAASIAAERAREGGLWMVEAVTRGGVEWVRVAGPRMRGPEWIRGESPGEFVRQGDEEVKETLSFTRWIGSLASTPPGGAGEGSG